MLILKRRADESISIGDDVTIIVLSIDRGIVRLGIDAPRQVPVHRSEVAEVVRRQRDEATRAEPA